MLYIYSIYIKEMALEKKWHNALKKKVISSFILSWLMAVERFLTLLLAIHP